MQADIIHEEAVAPYGASPTASEEAEATYLTFDLDGQTFAVAVQRVREILDTQPLTRLPNTPHEIRGVIDVRGASIPIVDLSARLGTGSPEEGPDTRVIVFELDDAKGHPKPMGVLADRVRDVCRIEPDCIEPAPDLSANGLPQDIVVGLSRREETLVVVIDLLKVFSEQSLHAF